MKVNSDPKEKEVRIKRYYTVSVDVVDVVESSVGGKFKGGGPPRFPNKAKAERARLATMKYLRYWARVNKRLNRKGASKFAGHGGIRVLS